MMIFRSVILTLLLFVVNPCLTMEAASADLRNSQNRASENLPQIPEGQSLEERVKSLQDQKNKLNSLQEYLKIINNEESGTFGGVLYYVTNDLDDKYKKSYELYSLNQKVKDLENKKQRLQNSDLSDGGEIVPNDLDTQLESAQQELDDYKKEIRDKELKITEIPQDVLLKFQLEELGSLKGKDRTEAVESFKAKTNLELKALDKQLEVLQPQLEAAKKPKLPTKSSAASISQTKSKGVFSRAKDKVKDAAYKTLRLNSSQRREQPKL